MVVRLFDHMSEKSILHEANLKTLKRGSGVSNDRSFALKDLVDSVFERSVLVGRSNGVTSRSEQISSDLPCLLVGEEKESQTDS